MKENSKKENAVNNLCTGCGVCVSESNGTLEMRWNKFGFISPYHVKGDIPNTTMRVCPFNPKPELDISDEDKLAKIFLKDTDNRDEKIGSYLGTFVGYSREHRITSSSGGIATYIFAQLLERKVVDAVYVVKEVNGTYEYQMFSKKEDITNISKTRYIPVTLEKLFERIDKLDGKIAVSGVACFIKAIRLKQYYHPELRNKIPFLVGIICGGWKSRFFTEFLAQSSGIQTKYKNQDYRIKDPKSSASDYAFGAYDEKDDFFQMKMSKVGDMWGTGLFKSKACDFCTDVLTELADISLGDAWLPQYRSDGLGNSVIVTRSNLANNIIMEGIAKGDLRVSLIDKSQIILSQSSSFSHRWGGLKFRVRMARLSGIKVPYIRKRVFEKISLPYMMVQIQRERTRKYSLIYWYKTKNADNFNKLMHFDLKVLRALTRMYHKLRKRK
ncbi:Coenzyme F420 hydrogenase/dehydrogenase, beta subunit C-terminal domain [Sphingobacterium sp. DN00404]|uniref:Coenzyme F420 hydrogenase/dehydrogenase, beta subunit C-terminal domain n=1 Tax=Sphingobacterium micropteri TaxID=2763501 RepID=A0ABR7YKI2_9SPHI|nr:Coenzyme F420 hydrogenase/dehydrogenase, beta subunit C-terminal domain [Sphingobacterium micropteri]MBD1431812.1 Coenzyme F420 hydrogenase/dehydrogenase, beta subunit C-terminal domain [Sphingobacterium micropteri]